MKRFTDLKDGQYLHPDLTKSRSARDASDLSKFIEWFQCHNPFDGGQPELVSLTTGLSTSEGDGVNCDQTESVGSLIQRTMDNKCILDVKIPKKHHIKTLQHLEPSVEIDGEKIQVDRTILFMRCMAITKRMEIESPAPFFKHEMTNYPVSMFKDYFMRHAEKSELANILIEKKPNFVNEADSELITIVDGGWLLNKVMWSKNTTFEQVADQYKKYVYNHFGIASIVIFDGYEMSTTKDHEHLRRNLGKKISPSVCIQSSTITKYDQDVFFRNAGNKTKFIELLSSTFKEANIATKTARGDADTIIVSEALLLARNGQTVQIACNDTDVLVMALYHYDACTMSDIRIHRETTVKKRTRIQNISISKLSENIPDLIKEHILFIHAFSGCDTTSQIYGHSKSWLLKPIEKQTVHSLVHSSSQTSVRSASSQLLNILCSGEDYENLTEARYNKLQKMIASCDALDPKRLPPTESAAENHGLRVHLQVAQWASLDEFCLNPTEWGWKQSKNGLVPILTDLPVAPTDILKFIICNCKAKKNQCGSNHCSCVKHGLKCVEACGHCGGQQCKNTPNIDMSED